MSDRVAADGSGTAQIFPSHSERLVEHYCPEIAHISQLKLNPRFQDPNTLRCLATGALIEETKPKSLPKDILAAKCKEKGPQPSDMITVPLLDFVMQALEKTDEPTPDVLGLLDNLRQSVKFSNPENSEYSTQIRTQIKKLIQLGLTAAQRFKANQKVTSTILKACFFLSSIVGKMSLYLEILVKASELDLLDEHHVPDFSSIAISQKDKFRVVYVPKPVRGIIQQLPSNSLTLPSDSHAHANTQIHFDSYRAIMDQGDYFTALNRYPCPLNPEGEDSNIITSIFQFKNNGVKCFPGLGTIWATQYSDMGLFANRNKGYSRIWNFSYNKQESMSTQVLDSKLRAIKGDFGNSTSTYWCGNDQEFFYRVAFYKSSKAGVAEAVSKVISISKYPMSNERYSYQQPISEIPIKSDEAVVFDWPDTEANNHRVVLLNGLILIVGHNNAYWVIDPETGTLFATGKVNQSVNGIDHYRQEIAQAYGKKITYMPYQFFYQYSCFRKTLLKINSDVVTSKDNKSPVNVMEILGLKTCDESFEESDYEPEEEQPAKTEIKKTNSETPADPASAPVVLEKAESKVEPSSAASSPPAAPTKHFNKETGKVFAAVLDVLAGMVFRADTSDSLQDLTTAQKESFLTSFDGPEPIPATFNSLHSLLNFLYTSFKGNAFFDSVQLSLLYLVKAHLDRVDLVQDRNTSGVRLVPLQTLTKIAELLVKQIPEVPKEISFEPKKRATYEPTELTHLRGCILAKLYLAGVEEANKDGMLFSQLLSYSVIFPRNLLKRVIKEYQQTLIQKKFDFANSLLSEPSMAVILTRMKKALEFEKDVLPNHFTFDSKQRPTHPELRHLQENLRPLLTYIAHGNSKVFSGNKLLETELFTAFDIGIEGFKLAASMMRVHGSFNNEIHHDFSHFWQNTVGLQLHQYLSTTTKKFSSDWKVVQVLSLVPDFLNDILNKDDFDQSLYEQKVNVSSTSRLYCCRFKVSAPESEIRVETKGPITAKYFKDSPNSLIVWGYLHDLDTSKHSSPVVHVYSLSDRLRKIYHFGLQGYLSLIRNSVRQHLDQLVAPLRNFSPQVDEWELLSKIGFSLKTLDVSLGEITPDSAWDLLSKSAKVPEKQDSPPTNAEPAKPIENVGEPETTSTTQAPSTGEAVATETTTASEPTKPSEPEQKTEQPTPAAPEIKKDIESALVLVAKILNLEFSTQDKESLLAVLKPKSQLEQWTWLLLWSNLEPSTSSTQTASYVLKMRRAASLFSPKRIGEIAEAQKEGFKLLHEVAGIFRDSNIAWKEVIGFNCELLGETLKPYSRVVASLTSGKALVLSPDQSANSTAWQALVEEYSVYLWTKPPSDNGETYFNRILFYCLKGLADLTQILGEGIKFDVTKLLVLQGRLKDAGSENSDKYLRVIASRNKQGFPWLCDQLQKMKPDEVWEDKGSGDYNVRSIAHCGLIPAYVVEFLKSQTNLEADLTAHAKIIATPSSEEYMEENCMSGYPERETEGGEMTYMLQCFKRCLDNEIETNLTEMANHKNFPLSKLVEWFVDHDRCPAILYLCRDLLIKVSPFLNREDPKVSKILKEALDLLAGCLERYFTCLPKRTFDLVRAGCPSSRVFIEILKAYAALKNPNSIWVNQVSYSVLEVPNPLPELSELKQIITRLSTPEQKDVNRKQLLIRAEEILESSIHPSLREMAPDQHKLHSAEDGRIRGNKISLQGGLPPSGAWSRLRTKVYPQQNVIQKSCSSNTDSQVQDFAVRLKKQMISEALTDFSDGHQVPFRQILKFEKDHEVQPIDLSAFEHWVLLGDDFEERIQMSNFVDSSKLRLISGSSDMTLSASSLRSQASHGTIVPTLPPSHKFTFWGPENLIKDAPPTISVKMPVSATLVLIPDASRLSLASLSSLFNSLSSVSPACSTTRLQKLVTLHTQLTQLQSSDKLPRMKPADLKTIVEVLGMTKKKAFWDKWFEHSQEQRPEIPFSPTSHSSTDPSFVLFELFSDLHSCQASNSQLLYILKNTSCIRVDPNDQTEPTIVIPPNAEMLTIDKLALSCFGALLGAQYLLPNPSSIAHGIDQRIRQTLVGLEPRIGEQSLPFDLSDKDQKDNDLNLQELLGVQLPQSDPNYNQSSKFIQNFSLARNKSTIQILEAIRTGFNSVVKGLLIPGETADSIEQRLVPSRTNSTASKTIQTGTLVRLYSQYKENESDLSSSNLKADVLPALISSGGKPIAAPAGASTAQVIPPPPPPPPQEEEDEVSLGGLFD